MSSSQLTSKSHQSSMNVSCRRSARSYWRSQPGVSIAESGIPLLRVKALGSGSYPFTGLEEAATYMLIHFRQFSESAMDSLKFVQLYASRDKVQLDPTEGSSSADSRKLPHRSAQWKLRLFKYLPTLTL